MKKLDIGKTKLVALTSMTIFSLGALLMGAYAWFVGKMDVSQSADDFGIYNEDSSITTYSCYAIKYDGTYGASATKLISGQQNNLAMSEYDFILKDKNINTPLFLRIEIVGFDSNKDLLISIPANGGYKANGQNYIENYLSNVVCAKFSYGLQSGNSVVPDTYNLTQNTETGSDVNTIYTGMRDRMANVQGTPFVVNSTTKNSQIHLTLSHNEIYQPQFIMNTTIEGETYQKVVVYIEFDYYVSNTVNLVQDFIDSYSGTGVEHSTSFRPDIGTISLKDVG